MFRKLFAFALALPLLAGMASAGAVTQNLGPIAPGNAVVSALVSTAPGAAFGADDFQFTISGTGSFSVSASVSNVFPYQGFSAFAFPSFSAQLTSPSLPAPVSFTPSFDAQVLALVPPANLLAGTSYSVLVNGLSGVLGAGYIVSVAVAVPEPPAAILLCAGLAVLLVRTRRRERSAA